MRLPRLKHARRTAVGALVALAALLGSAGLVVPATAASTAPPAVLFPSNGAFFGARVEPRGDESRLEAVARTEAQVGRRFAVERVYEQWGTAFPTTSDRQSAALGRILYVSWKPATSWGSIARGAEDAWIATRADAVRAFGQPMYLSFNHEPENDGSRGSPADFVAAYRRVVDIFRSHGVSNVAFAWTMMSSSFTDGAAEANAFYPGDSYVDVIGVDGYNWYPGKAGTQWRSFAEVLSPAHQFALSHATPMIVAEYGVQEDPAQPGRKAQWFRDALQTTRSWPDVKGLLYFNSTKIYPWIVDSSSSSLAAFSAMGADAWMRPALGSVPSSPGPSPSTFPRPTLSPTATPSSRPTLSPTATISPRPSASATPTTSPRPSPSPSGVPAPAGTGALLGATVVPRTAEDADSAVRRFEGQIGRSLAVVRQPLAWDEPVADALPATAAVPFVAWSNERANGTEVSAAQIASGASDARIAAVGAALSRVGPAYLSFDVRGVPDDAVDAAAFRRVVQGIRAAGATGVRFVWTQRNKDFATLDPAAYPGDDVVDLIGVEGFNWYGVFPDSRWRSFGEIVQPALDFASGHAKPVAAVRVGTLEDPADPARKARWFTDALLTMRANPAIQLFVYLDANDMRFWAVDTSPASILAFRLLAADAWLARRV